jgi:hypothetical protein
MMTRLKIVIGLCLLATIAVAALFSPLLAADEDAKASVLAAAKRLAEQSSYGWQTTTQASGGPVRGFRGAGPDNGPVSGQIEKDQFTHVTQPGVQFVAKGGQAAVLVGDYWMTIDQAASRGGGESGGRGGQGGFNPATISGFKLPAASAEEIVAKASDLKRDGETVTAALDAQTVNELLGGGGFGGRRGGGQQQPAAGGKDGAKGKDAAKGKGAFGKRGNEAFGGGLTNAKGTVTFSIKDGLLTQFTLALSGTREFRG